jgi:hypothetical protein
MQTTSLTIASSIAVRLRFLAGQIHKLGERPLYELLCELSTSSAALDRFEAYAAIDPDILDQFGGHALPPVVRLIKQK